MPMPHRTFAQVAKRRLVGKEGRERIREVQSLLAELPDYKNGPYADLHKSLLAEIDDTRVRSSVVHRDSIAVRREGAARPDSMASGWVAITRSATARSSRSCARLRSDPATVGLSGASRPQVTTTRRSTDASGRNAMSMTARTR